MKFLCIHGGLSSPSTLAKQLKPITQELERDGSATFYFAKGPKEGSLHPELERVMGLVPEPPHLNWLDYRECDGIWVPTRASIASALEYIDHNYVEPLGPFDGVVGFSEGALLATSLIAREARESRQTGKPRMYRCGAFFAGIPPLDDDDGNDVRTAPIDGEVICMPTLHVMGMRDGILDRNVRLYGLFNEDDATLIQHAKGHTIPDDQRSQEKILAGMRAIIESAGGRSA